MSELVGSIIVGLVVLHVVAHRVTCPICACSGRNPETEPQ